MEQIKSEEHARYLLCERRSIYLLLMSAAGMMGAYTFTLRGGAFCNAQTANIVLMSIALGEGRWQDALYFLIPISAYFMGAFISEALPSPVKKKGFLRWDTWLIAIELLTLLFIGFLPLTVPHQVVQVIINFIASMQYNTFRQSEGIPMATTFCTNHVRQLGIAAAKAVRKHDPSSRPRSKAHFKMLLSFLVSGAILSFAGQYLKERAIWLALIPLFIALVNLIHADLTVEHDELLRKPSGH